MDFTSDENIHAQVLTLRHFIKKELQPLEDEVEAKVILDSNTTIEIFEKSRYQDFYGMNIPAEYAGEASMQSGWFVWNKRWNKAQIRLSLGPLRMFMKYFWLVKMLNGNSGCFLV